METEVETVLVIRDKHGVLCTMGRTPREECDGIVRDLNELFKAQGFPLVELAEAFVSTTYKVPK